MPTAILACPTGALEEEVDLITTEDDAQGFEEESEALNVQLGILDEQCPCGLTFEGCRGCPPANSWRPFTAERFLVGSLS